MRALLARPILCWVTTTAGMVAGCTGPNPAYIARDGTAGPSQDAGPGTPDSASRPDVLSPPDDASPPDGDDVDVPSPPDDASRPGGEDAAFVEVGVPDGATPPDGQISCSAPATGSGTGLRAEYFDNSDFTGTRVSRTDPTIDWDFGQGSPDPGLDSDNFSARWTGRLQPLVSGPHTFVASYNDGMRMFLDERVVLYRWGPHITAAEDRATVVLDAGRTYDLRFEFFDQGSAALSRLHWESPCHSRQVIPKEQLYPVAPTAPVCLVEQAAGSGTGLLVEYFSGEPSPARLLATGHVARLDFDWGTGTPASGVPADGFSARWTGTLEAPIDGPLTIYLSTDDVGRLRFGGVMLLDSWSEPFGPQEIAATVDVRAGQRYDLLIEHREQDGGAFAHLSWSWPCHPREIVPTTRLYRPQ